jgi:hypothetical protein
MIVKFLEDVVAQFASWDDPSLSRPRIKGEIVDLPDSLAQRLIRTNLAVKCDDRVLTSGLGVRGRPPSAISPTQR